MEKTKSRYIKATDSKGNTKTIDTWTAELLPGVLPGGVTRLCDLPHQQAPKRFTLDGEPIPDLGCFTVENDLDPETLNAIGRLDVGETLILGGGAAAEFIFKREE